MKECGECQGINHDLRLKDVNGHVPNAGHATIVR